MITTTKEILDSIEEPLFEDPKALLESERHLTRESFFFEGTNGKGVLLAHGWTSTPYEVRRLGKFLNVRGYTVYGLLLKGHGTEPSDLEDVNWTDWVEDMERGYEKLKVNYDKVYVAGTSIGAALTLILARKISEISGIILMATPYKMRMEKMMNLFARVFLLVGKRYYKKFYPPSFGSSGMVTRLVSYQTFPVKSVLDAIRTTREARKDTHLITQPCLIMQSTHDHIVTADSLECIYGKISSKVKIKKYIEKAYHTFVADINNEHVFDDILSFLEKN